MAWSTCTSAPVRPRLPAAITQACKLTSTWTAPGVPAGTTFKPALPMRRASEAATAGCPLLENEKLLPLRARSAIDVVAGSTVVDLVAKTIGAFQPLGSAGFAAGVAVVVAVPAAALGDEPV